MDNDAGHRLVAGHRWIAADDIGARTILITPAAHVGKVTGPLLQLGLQVNHGTHDEFRNILGQTEGVETYPVRELSEFRANETAYTFGRALRHFHINKTSHRCWRVAAPTNEDHKWEK